MRVVSLLFTVHPGNQRALGPAFTPCSRKCAAGAEDRGVRTFVLSFRTSPDGSVKRLRVFVEALTSDPAVCTFSGSDYSPAEMRFYIPAPVRRGGTGGS